MKKLKKFAASITSIILIAVISMITPIQVAALTLSDVSNTISSADSSVPNDEVTEEGNIIGEDVTKRDEYTKHFITDAGTTIAAQYAVPVHYKNADGEYVEYDNSLTTGQATADEATTDEATVEYMVAEDTVEETFTNKKSDKKVSFFKKSGKSKLTEVGGEYPVSWSYSGAKIVTAKESKKAKSAEELTGNDAYLTLQNLSGKVVYEDIYNSVDLESITTTTGVKENLILKASNARNVFKIDYNIGALTAKSIDERTIELLDSTGKAVYTISAPYMVDAEGEQSEALTLKILSNNKGKLSVKLTADKTWLSDASRAYPVTVDPTFLYGQDLGDGVYCAYMNSYKGNTRFDAEGSVYVGRPNADDGIRRSVIRVQNLPKLNIGDMVVQAEFAMNQATRDATIDMYVGVYEVTEPFTKSKIIWSNPLSCSNVLIDYEKVPKGTKEWRIWDITELVKKWYNGGANNGFYLKMMDEADTDQGLQFTSTLYPTDADYRPALRITYLNNKGLEDYWTYTSIGAGSAGTAYINDYSGNLVFEMPLAETHGLSLPTGISYYYNSYFAGEKYDVTAPHTGRGWKMNIQQTLIKIDEDSDLGKIGYKYVLTDADGTEHYFKKVTEDGTEKILDEDGLKLEVIENGTLTVINEDKCKWNFSSSGLLTSIEDNVGNKATINYSASNSKIIESITDGDGKTIRFALNDNNNKYVQTITDSNGDVTTMDYTGSYLTQVTKPDGSKVYFSYDSEGLLTSVTNVDNAKLCFTYDTEGSRGVASVQEYGTDSTSATNGTVGQKMTFDRSKYNTTIVRTSGTDCEFNTNDDIITEQQFDNLGRTISLYNKVAATGEILGAAATEYNSGTPDTTNSNIKYLNKVTKNYSMGANRENLLVNHNMEGTTGWKYAAWGSATVSGTMSESTTALYGQKSVMINVTSVTGDARGRIYQDVEKANLEQGATYTLSAYVKTEDITPIAEDDTYGAVIAVTPFYNDGSSTNIYSDHISRDTDTDINEGFRRLSVTFTVPTNSEFKKLRINLALHSAAGKAYFDAVQLEKSDAASNYNMLENASFERSGPASWGGTNLSNSDGRCTTAIDGGASLYVTGDVDTAKNFHQDVAISGNKQDTYILSGWAYGNAVPNTTNSSYFELRVRVYYSDGTNITKRSAVFNTSVSGWQYSSFVFNLDNDKEDDVTPTSIRVYAISFRQGNTVCFDNLQLTKEAVPTYTYDEDGNLISVVANAQQKSEYKYENSSLTYYEDPKGYDYEYEYDEDTNLLTKATTQLGATYTYVYDEAGNATSMEAEAPPVDEDTGETLYLRSNVTYNYPDTDDETYSVDTYDNDGRRVTSVYDADKGTLISTNVEGDPAKTTDDITTTYTYKDTNDLPLTIARGDQSVSYVYDAYNRLTSIDHEGTTYSFVYDVFGNREVTKVGSRTLATYDYEDYNGYLKKITYGNGHNVSYTYDRFGNYATVAYNGTVVAKNFADSSGAIVRSQDLISNLEHRVSYDTTGRPISKEVLDLSATYNTDRWLRSLEYNYDLNNNVTHFAYADRYGSNVTSYEYGKDNLLTKTTLDNDKAVTYTYDNLGRLTGKTLDTTSPVNTAYTYHNSARGTVDGKTYTTTKLKTENVAGTTYQYTYDVHGNITKIFSVTSDGTKTQIHKYEYDEYGQLTRDMDTVNGVIIDYGYDDSGNINRKKTTAWNANPSSPELGEEIEDIYYTYGDAEWGDLLTTYNGQTITYDAIGNPLTYRDGISLTWQNGRELATFANSDTSVAYTYDVDGMRTSKTITSGTTTDNVEYVYEGGLLLQMRYNHMILDFSYDANGSPVSMAYRSTATGTPIYYYYALNFRGDVEGLYNSAGTLIAKYSYDAYGKSLGVTTASGSAISAKYAVPNLNPLRYRGYVYDNETGFYYLQSRYYDPTTCRFINADGYCATGQGITGNNMFVYCGNNPITFVDYSGTRYCAGANPDDETYYEISTACQWQNRVVKSKYNPEPIDTYSGGNIYLVDNVNDISAFFPGDIIVIDNRDKDENLEKNLEIWNSYLITDKTHQSEIVLSLLQYEIDNPTGWNRTYDSMMIEWDAHNISYGIFNIIPFREPYGRAKHVSFDNRDEGKSYWDHTVGRVFGGQ